ncbi:hypothetical protein Slin15195_G078350 [Septoria linicola]|uniref:Uncharacterized protein n=1 Tax=Septoria linicola TaxID=215465 RepID=A0A9Q9AZC8_9PEZI|nr:hypothetical protein Slin14017_G039540 [Septoria linicola]USW54516.1 hypothetical protein Slin15195_G078350 [Septoria linicola]
MLFTFLTTSLLALLTISTQVACASPRSPRYNYGNQIPIGDTLVLEPEPTETVTIHYTVTKTRYEFEFRTKTATRTPTKVFAPVPYYTVLPEHGVVVKGPPLQQPRRKPETCDETACALCRWQGGCRENDVMCFLCDKEPYCDCS